MGKLLTRKETEEIIYSLFEEYGLDKPIIEYHEGYSSSYWRLFKYKIKTLDLFFWAGTYKVLENNPWCDADSLEALVIATERQLQTLDSRVEKADQIRQRHASRLLDEKLKK